MAERTEILAFFDRLLDASACPDYGPNGLQVEGRSEIHHIVCGVTASLALVEAAIDARADAIVVHHGILWGGTPTLTGAFGRRVGALMRADLNLLAYHLPLDRHLEIGNAASFARLLGLTDWEAFGQHKGTTVGVRAAMPETTIAEFTSRVMAVTGRDPVVFPFGPERIRSVGIITGGADRDVSQAIAAGLDVYVTGEASEPSMHTAREEGIHFIAAGHHATERYGVQSLCQRLQETFDITWEYIEIDNPV